MAKRVQTAGLINGIWTVFPRDYKFPNGMTMAHLVDSWLLSDGQQRIPPFFFNVASKPSNKRATKGASKNKGYYDACEKAWSVNGMLDW